MRETILTNGQLICISKMMSALRLDSGREQLVSEITKGRTSNFRMMYVHEATDLIRHLKTLKPSDVLEMQH